MNNSPRLTLRIGWDCLRLPLLGLLLVFEPLIRFCLTSLAVLSLVSAIFYHLARAPMLVPVFALLGITLLCGIALLTYRGALRLLSSSLK
jgi:hypothetical protein